MAYTLTYNPETHVVESKVWGTVNLGEMIEIYSEVAQILAEKETFMYFADYREAKLNLSTMEIYGIPKMLSNIAASLGLNAYRLRQAVVMGSNAADYSFFETTSLNSGQYVKLFQNDGEAQEWLVSRSPRQM